MHTTVVVVFFKTVQVGGSDDWHSATISGRWKVASGNVESTVRVVSGLALVWTLTLSPAGVIEPTDRHCMSQFWHK